MRAVLLLVISVFGIVFVIGCAVKPLPAVAITVPTRTIDYLKEVKPILDKRSPSVTPATIPLAS